MKLTARKYIGDDGSVTLSLDEIDLAENAPTEEEALNMLTESLIEYSQDYIDDLDFWSSAPNRIEHLNYIREIIKLSNVEYVKSMIIIKSVSN